MFDHEMREVAERVLHACRQRKLRVVTAESCTGGLIAATLTAIAGSSDVVDRAFITYSNEAKREMLATMASRCGPMRGASQINVRSR